MRNHTWRQQGGSPERLKASLPALPVLPVLPALAGMAALAVIGVGLCLTSCLSISSYSQEPTVTLAWQEQARRLAILAKDLGLNARIQPRGALPYSHNASTAIWLGKNFPYDKAIQMIRWGHGYYKELRYIALSDRATPATDRYDYDLFLGGSTKKALHLNLKAWSPADFRKLYRAKSQAAFHALIRAHYRPRG